MRLRSCNSFGPLVTDGHLDDRADTEPADEPLGGGAAAGRLWVPASGADGALICKTVAENLRRERHQAQMGQHKLGDRAELPRDTVGRIERSEQEARLRTLRKISAALQVPLRSLLDGLLD